MSRTCSSWLEDHPFVKAVLALRRSSLDLLSAVIRLEYWDLPKFVQGVLRELEKKRGIVEDPGDSRVNGIVLVIDPEIDRRQVQFRTWSLPISPYIGDRNYAVVRLPLWAVLNRMRDVREIVKAISEDWIIKDAMKELYCDRLLLWLDVWEAWKTFVKRHPKYRIGGEDELPPDFWIL